MTSTSLNDLHPDLIPLAEDFLQKCRKAGLNIKVTCTYRSPEEQDALYEQGRSVPGYIVTNAKGGQSEHNYEINSNPASKGFDIVPIVNGKAIWLLKDPTWLTIGKIWRGMEPINNYYLYWYGSPGSTFSEKCHFCLKKCSDT
jgi:peptidoglycan L-alanyl-D-glutamate endopeptidase CwlK